MKNVSGFVICFIAFLIFIGWLGWVDKEKERYKENNISFREVSSQVTSRTDTLLVIIEGQHQIQKYLLSLKHDVDSLKSVKR